LKKLSQESFIQDWRLGYLMGKIIRFTCLACYDMRECCVT